MFAFGISYRWNKLEEINMSAGGSNVLMSLKNKMQNLRDELEKYKDMFDEKCQELEEEKAKSQEVSSLKFSFLPVFFRDTRAIAILPNTVPISVH